ncbi:hypothetical protein ZIOFF_030033 [Zingiber officinale]|uniref:Pectinesterase n=1 Tax=Zingiber officinale TaxID=94328 RepID=A0A8J5GNQ6_ZINOF|nr:hypothetical protein ZIOFF_030033 [Zingiber officinale]
MASALLLLLVFSVLILRLSAAAHRSPSDRRVSNVLPGARADPSTTVSASGAIEQACAASRFRQLCVSALSSSPHSLPPNPSAVDLSLAAVSASARGLQVACANARAILEASAANVNRTNAARNCLEFLSLADYRLSTASKALSAGDLGGARLFAGAAELYQYDCWSAYKYVNGTQQVADAMAYLYALANLTGSAASMVAALQRYGSNMSLWAPPQTERDGYWPPDVPTGKASERVAATAASEEWSPDATVCKDGGGCQFTTVQAAVDAAPSQSPRRHVIYIRQGIYEETVRVPLQKPNLAFIGDGMGKTIITGSLNAGVPGISTYNTATVGELRHISVHVPLVTLNDKTIVSFLYLFYFHYCVDHGLCVAGDGFMARDLTFDNTAGPDAHQAVAFRSDSDLSVLDSVEFLGHQDTLYAHSLRQFYTRCRIAGTVDFVFGNSAAVFRGCLLLVLPRQLNPEKGESDTVTAHGRTDPAQPTGFVFDRCSVTGSDDYLAFFRSKPAVHRVYLGRPWKEYSRTVFLNCQLSGVVRPEGWLPWDGDFALATLYYGEFGNSGEGANATGRVAWSSRIPAEHLGAYSVENFIQGNRWIPPSLLYDIKTGI